MKKVFIIVLIISILFVACGKQDESTNTPSSTATSTLSVTPTLQNTPPVHTFDGNVAQDDRNVPNEYLLLIADYKSTVQYRLSEDFEEKYNNGALTDLQKYGGEESENELNYDLHCMVVEMLAYTNAPTPEMFGYIFKDINNDGIKEAFLLCQSNILAVFTHSEGAVYLLDAFWPKHHCTWHGEDLLYIRGSDGAITTQYTVKQLLPNATKLSVNAEYIMEYNEDNSTYQYFKFENGSKVPVPEAEFNTLIALFL